MLLGFLVRNRKVYLLGRRIHHGRVGALLAAVGVVLMVDDILDFPWRLRDDRR